MLPRALLACVCLFVAGTALAGPPAPAASLLPQPVDVRMAPSGTATIADGARVATLGGAPVHAIAERFIRLVAGTRGLQLQLAATAEAHPAITFEVEPKASVRDDGYRIEVGAQAIHVVARSASGAYYGAVTLWQLLTPAGWVRGSPAGLAQGVIEDYPRFAWRGLLLDSGRHFQSVAEIENLIDWMSLEKLNVLLWHLTDDQGWRLEVPKYPELTKTGACRTAKGLDIELTGAAEKPYCGFYTEADVREVVRYAADRFVTLVPEIDLPGHAQAAVAAYPWLGVTGERPAVWTDWGISPWLLKPAEKSLEFVEAVLDEVMRLFPSSFVSIGGDEADKQQWNASPELRTRMQQLKLANMEQLQGWFTGQIADYLVSHGRRPVGWDDPLLAGVKLPASEVVMSWHEQRLAFEAAAQGHDIILTPTESLYFDYYQSDLPDEWQGQPPTTTLRQAYDTVLMPKGASDAQLKHVIGVQANLWTELMPRFANVQHALFPRIAALSELAWSSAGAHDWSGFLRRLGAELARYRALGIGYADSAFAPAFTVSSARDGLLRVALSNQVSFGDLRYTTDGSAPVSTSTPYAHPLDFPATGAIRLRAATFSPEGLALAEPRGLVLDASVVRRRESGTLESCSKRPAMRLDGSRPSEGARPVYKVYVGDMCWLSTGAPPGRVSRVALTVERLTWRFGDEAKESVVRSTASADGEFEVHAGSCSGPLLARLPLPAAQQGDGPRVLNASVVPAGPVDARVLCIFATGDPRKGLWALAQAAFSQ